MKIISVVGARPNFMNLSCLRYINNNCMKAIRIAHEIASLSSRAGMAVGGGSEPACGRQVTNER